MARNTFAAGGNVGCGAARRFAALWAVTMASPKASVQRRARFWAEETEVTYGNHTAPYHLRPRRQNPDVRQR